MDGTPKAIKEAYSRSKSWTNPLRLHIYATYKSTKDRQFNYIVRVLKICFCRPKEHRQRQQGPWCQLRWRGRRHVQGMRQQGPWSQLRWRRRRHVQGMRQQGPWSQLRWRGRRHVQGMRQQGPWSQLRWRERRHVQGMRQQGPGTVIRFVWVSAKFGTCTVVNVNGSLVEDKMRRFKWKCAHFSFNKCPIYAHDGESAKFSTNSYETDNSVESTQMTRETTCLRYETTGTLGIPKSWANRRKILV
jgi:hypothetical protein